VRVELIISAILFMWISRDDAVKGAVIVGATIIVLLTIRAVTSIN
jgi:hypothetical protein